MSHLTSIELSVSDLKSLKKAIKKLGGEFKENQKEFIYYAGNKGQCVHAASFEGCSYELGITKEKGQKDYSLAWDNWYSGNLESVLGKNADKLKQQYSYFAATSAARLQGYTTTEKVLEDGRIQLTIAV